MARKTRIVSFDDAKSASEHRFAQDRPSRRSRSNRTDDPARLSKTFDYQEPYAALRSSGLPGVADGTAYPADRNTRRGVSRGGGSSQTATYERGLELTSGRSRRNAPSLAEVGQHEATAANSTAKKRESRRRAKAKARADKMFAQQIAAEPQPDGLDGDAPRAALYEGRMGASHKKSTRMQKAATAEPQSAKLDPAGWFSKLNLSARMLKTGTAALCLVLTALFLYVPAQQYYQATREHDKLAAEYAELERRNDALNAQNDALSSNAGMEDAVRQKYGYVKNGDETAVVSGLSDQTMESSRSRESVEANVLSSSIKAPEEWYTPYLDAFFGVS